DLVISTTSNANKLGVYINAKDLMLYVKQNQSVNLRIMSVDPTKTFTYVGVGKNIYPVAGNVSEWDFLDEPSNCIDFCFVAGPNANDLGGYKIYYECLGASGGTFEGILY